MTDHPRHDDSVRLALYNSLRAKLQALYRRDQYEIHGKVLEFHDYLKSKYANARDHLFFHLISGSTLKEFYGDTDLPAPDSVEGFINAEYNLVFPDGEQTVADKADNPQVS